VPSPSNSSRFYLSNNIGWGVQIMKLLIIKFSPIPCRENFIMRNFMCCALFLTTRRLLSVHFCERTQHF
jgi:hypothetical protein